MEWRRGEQWRDQFRGGKKEVRSGEESSEEERWGMSGDRKVGEGRGGVKGGG